MAVLRAKCAVMTTPVAPVYLLSARCGWIAGAMLVVAATAELFAATVRSTSAIEQSAAGAAPTSLVLLEATKVKVRYGETVLPPGTKLPVVTIAGTTVRVRYLNEEVSLPLAVVRFDDQKAGEQPIASPTATARGVPTAAAPTVTVTLQRGFDSRMNGGEGTMRELQSLLSPHCSPDVDLTGAGVLLYSGVRYLMQADEAARMLGLPRSVVAHGQVAAPGFPRSSLSFSAFETMREGDFNRLMLITDTANRVVAVQLIAEHPSNRDQSGGDDKWKTYDFIQAGLRASDTMTIATDSRRDGDVIAIDTQLFQRYGLHQRGSRPRVELKQKTKLLLPVPFARIVLHCIQGAQPK